MYILPSILLFLRPAYRAFNGYQGTEKRLWQGAGARINAGLGPLAHVHGKATWPAAGGEAGDLQETVEAFAESTTTSKNVKKKRKMIHRT